MTIFQFNRPAVGTEKLVSRKNTVLVKIGSVLRTNYGHDLLISDSRWQQINLMGGNTTVNQPRLDKKYRGNVVPGDSECAHTKPMLQPNSR